MDEFTEAETVGIPGHAGAGGIRPQGYVVAFVEGVRRFYARSDGTYTLEVDAARFYRSRQAADDAAIALRSRQPAAIVERIMY